MYPLLYEGALKHFYSFDHIGLYVRKCLSFFLEFVDVLKKIGALSLPFLFLLLVVEPFLFQEADDASPRVLGQFLLQFLLGFRLVVEANI